MGFKIEPKYDIEIIKEYEPEEKQWRSEPSSKFYMPIGVTFGRQDSYSLELQYVPTFLEYIQDEDDDGNPYLVNLWYTNGFKVILGAVNIWEGNGKIAKSWDINITAFFHKREFNIGITNTIALY